MAALRLTLVSHTWANIKIMPLSKIAVVTGAASGIGYETVRQFLDLGFTVVGCDLNEQGLSEHQTYASEKGSTFYGVVIDITSDVEYEKIARILEQYGQLDILVNAAGICSGTPLSEITRKEWDRTYAVNVEGPFFLSRRLVDFLTKGQDPTIINISSMAGFTGGIQSNPAYSSSKAAMTCMTKNMAKFYAGLGIRVNEVAPGTARTAMTVNWLGDEGLEAFIPKVPMGRLAEADDIAKVIIFLASDAAGFMTGQSVHVNGGMYIP